MMKQQWKIRGEIVLSCNCDMFCPCVISLGQAEPTQGSCHTIFALNIDRGHAGRVKLDGLKAAALWDVPGKMAEGNWTVGLYIDKRATPAAAKALSAILCGKAGGTTKWISMMIGNYLGSKRAQIAIEKKDGGWHIDIPKRVDVGIKPITGAERGVPTKVTNSQYWLSSEIVVCRGELARFRDWGRNWDFSGQSAEYARFEWSGP